MEEKQFFIVTAAILLFIGLLLYNNLDSDSGMADMGSDMITGSAVAKIGKVESNQIDKNSLKQDNNLNNNMKPNICFEYKQRAEKICANGGIFECKKIKKRYGDCIVTFGTEYENVLQCNYDTPTGAKKCSSGSTSGSTFIQQNQILQEMKDSSNPKCPLKWELFKPCSELGTACKNIDGNKDNAKSNAECVGVSCKSFRDCIRFGGMMCNAGRCTKYCSDSDNGSPFVKGFTFDFRKNQRDEDYCFDRDTLIEFFCDPQYDIVRPGVLYPNYKKIKCDRRCGDGKCLP